MDFFSTLQLGNYILMRDGSPKGSPRQVTLISTNYVELSASYRCTCSQVKPIELTDRLAARFFRPAYVDGSYHLASADSESNYELQNWGGEHNWWFARANNFGGLNRPLFPLRYLHQLQNLLRFYELTDAENLIKLRTL